MFLFMFSVILLLEAPVSSYSSHTEQNGSTTACSEETSCFSPGYIRIITGDAGAPGDYQSPVLNQFMEDEESTADWTVMFYDDADCLNMYDPFTTFAGEIQSTDLVNVVVLRDTETGPARYYYLPQNGSPVILEELGEVNMGDAETLGNFIAYCKANYPAGRYILCVYDHGGGFYGACIDLSAGNDLLYMDEFQSAITANGGVDIIAWLACCTMGSLEAAYELRDCTEVYIVPSTHMPCILPGIRSNLHQIRKVLNHAG